MVFYCPHFVANISVTEYVRSTGDKMKRKKDGVKKKKEMSEVQTLEIHGGKALFGNETDLFEPVKLWLENEGFEVQGEIGKVDVYACKRVNIGEDREDTLTVAVELKLRPCLELLIQAAERVSSADLVYISFPEHKKAREIKNLCRLLGVGILQISQDLKAREYLAASPPKALLKNRGKRSLIEEFQKRRVRSTPGGTNGKVLTAYREEALSIAFLLRREEVISMKMLRERGVKKPEKYLYANYYAWFERAEGRGFYRLSEQGKKDIARYEQYLPLLDVL